jgi:hypothetical protein
MTVSILFAIAALLAVGEFLLFGALAEAYRDIRQLREQLGATDKPVPVELGKGQGGLPSSHGLPADLDSAVRAVVVFVDSHCGTCRMIMSSLAGSLPGGMWLAVMSDSTSEASQWLAETGFHESPSLARVVSIKPAEFERHLGMRITPLAVIVEHGRLASAHTVPSVRQFYAMVPTTLSLSAPTQREAPV